MKRDTQINGGIYFDNPEYTRAGIQAIQDALKRTDVGQVGNLGLTEADPILLFGFYGFSTVGINAHGSSFAEKIAYLCHVAKAQGFRVFGSITIYHFGEILEGKNISINEGIVDVRRGTAKNYDPYGHNKVDWEESQVIELDLDNIQF